MAEDTEERDIRPLGFPLPMIAAAALVFGQNSEN
jgi:hypothetical protein